MPVIKMEKECSCFKDSEYTAVTQCETIDEALELANKMCIDMNENFCGKHHFRAIYEDGNMKIKVEMNG